MPKLHPDAQRATDVLAEAAKAVQNDRTRPIYHITAPARWLNDPNGPVWHNGWYHMFYQLDPDNPMGDVKYWGHVRSRDMVRWEHLPVAIWPSHEVDEDGVWSGSAMVAPNGVPTAIYTSVTRKESPGTWAQQWIATAEDDDLIVWSKPDANPVMELSIHGDTQIYQWRDPFLFRVPGDETVYCVVGGRFCKDDGRGMVALYRAAKPDLTAWEFLGIMWENPDEAIPNHECPNFFPLERDGDRRWVLVVSPHREPIHYIGTFDPSVPAFAPESSGKFCHGQGYAPNTLFGPDGRTLLIDWIIQAEKGRDWNGCLTIPRVASLGEGGTLVQEPLPELAALRGEHTEQRDVSLGETPVTVNLPDDAAEIELEIGIDAAAALHIAVESGDGAECVAIRYEGGTLTVGTFSGQVPLVNGELRLRMFLDRCVLEVFAAQSEERWAVNIATPGPDARLTFTSTASATLRRLDAWAMGSIWK